MECPICCDVYTKKQRKEIQCGSCNYSACIECIKKYALESTHDIHCMNCMVQWPRSFTSEIFPKIFLKRDYKSHRENVLLDREKSKIVATLPYAEEEKRKREINEEIAKINKLKQEYQKKIKELNEVINTKRNEIYNSAIPVKKEFVRPCPSNECKGFLSTQWKCGLCNIWVCPDCHEIKGHEKNTAHTCDPNNIESAKEIKKNTKPCPSCSACIFKIDGCDQMWCSQCHTAFSWDTGRLEKGPIHNPHFYEYMRTNGTLPRNLGDIPYGGLPTVYRISRHLKKYKCENHAILDVLRCLSHIHFYEIPRYPVQELGTDIYQDLRIQYILNDISEEYWKKELQKREKKFESNKNMRFIFDMIINIGVDCVNKILNFKTEEEFTNLYNTMLDVRVRANAQFKEHASKFNSKTAKYISDEWIFETPKSTKMNQDDESR